MCVRGWEGVSGCEGVRGWEGVGESEGMGGGGRRVWICRVVLVT